MNFGSQGQQKRHAFTITEVMVGVGVMGLVFVALYSGMAFGFSFVATARENLRAAQILQERFEGMRLYNWDQVNSNGFISTNFSIPLYPNTTGAYYDGVVTITRPSFSQPYTNDLRLITIDLSWNSGGQRRSRSMSSLIAKYGIQN